MQELSKTDTRATKSLSQRDVERGAVYTKHEVVDFMLDLIEYTVDRPIYMKRILEPSFGAGNFLVPIITRLIDSFEQMGGHDYLTLVNCVRAVELDRATFEHTKSRITSLLQNRGLSKPVVDSLISAWLIRSDYLLETELGLFDYVIGNPPYIRQESIDSETLRVYRSKFRTMIGRSDIYIAFFQHALNSLNLDGTLSFICSDSWIKNAYGKGLRNLIASRYGLDLYIDMYGLPAFAHDVGAYTSITRIRNSPSKKLCTVELSSLDSAYLKDISNKLTEGNHLDTEVAIIDTPHTSAPWLLSGSEESTIVRDLEDRYPSIEEAGCSIGIGVATGADSIFIGKLDSLHVEESRKIPLATGKDIIDGRLSWSGKGVINPWDSNGKLIELERYPLTEEYLSRYHSRLRNRHTAKRDPNKLWYKTIDKIDASLINTPKLLIPDIRSNSQSIAYDSGTVYPHHGVYYITSNTWELRALQALLKFGLATLFVRTYSTRLGGGYVRFQAQNLRRIRIPTWDSLSPETKTILTNSQLNNTKLHPSFVADILQLTVSQCERIQALA